jgi:hypothetical protein
MVEQKANQQEATANVPRVLAGLQSGRIVHYVMKDGSHRPLLVIANFDNSVCGFLFLKSGDHDNLPAEAAAFFQPGQFAGQITSVSYDDALGVGTWHWPPRESVVAAAVDPEALATQIQGVAGALFEQERSELIRTVNAKFDAMVEHIADELTKHDMHIKKLIEDGLPLMVRGPLRPDLHELAAAENPQPSGNAGGDVGPAPAAPASVPAGVCAKAGCGRGPEDNVHHVTDRAKYHPFEAAAAAAAAASDTTPSTAGSNIGATEKV